MSRRAATNFFWPQGGIRTAEAPPRRYSPGRAKLLSFFLRQVLAERAQYAAQIPRIGRDSSQQQTDVKVPAIACFQHRLANVVVADMIEAKAARRPGRPSRVSAVQRSRRLRQRGD